MKYFFISLLCVIAFSATAQTRRIGHRSHSGSINTKADATDGNYGIYPTEEFHPMVIIHLESGRDTAVPENDSLARRTYGADTVKNKYRMPNQKKKIHGIGQMGQVTGKIIVANP